MRGEEIPLAARIFAVVDVWDALTSDRPYRAAWSPEQTREYIRDQAGKHFDPRVVQAFLELPEKTMTGLEAVRRDRPDDGRSVASPA
jgi:HD-GYP domain-containing protein (c-di-GMP phosphodiesterase class II)